MEQNISYIPQNALCTACGACAGVCGTGAISICENVGGYLYAKVDPAACVNCGKCLKVCPSVAAHETIEDVHATLHGNCLGGFIAHAANKEIRREGQSGGVVTALLLYLLESGKIDGAITNQFDTARCSSKAVYVTDGEGLLQSCGSYYVQSPVVEAIAAHGDKRLAATVLGCQSKALRLMADKGLPAPEYLIGLVCEGTYSRHMIAHMIDAAHCDPSEKPQRFLFRYSHPAYGGWPGNALLVTDRYRYRIDKSVRFSLKPLCESFRCLLCYDQVNVHADLVCGDPWGIPGDHTAGETTILARTEKGLQLLRDAEQAGYLCLEPLDVEQIMQGQGIDTLIQDQTAAGYVSCEKSGWLYPYTVSDGAQKTLRAVSSKAVKDYLLRLTYSRQRNLAQSTEEISALEKPYREHLERKAAHAARKAKMQLPLRMIRFAIRKLRKQ